MASAYGSGGTIAVAADTGLTVIGGTTVKARIDYILASCSGTPADATIDISVQQFTADGTGTAVTPEPLDVDDRVALCASKKTYSAEPTYAGINVLDLGFNQRSVFQWYAQPNGELVSSKAAGDGYGMRVDAFSTGTPTVQFIAHWKE